MGLSAGTRLGPYEILSPLGAGGMGEVWLARDTRIGRDVALKVLPEDFLESEERKSRFEREARTLASLNHPNIATLYSFEEIPGPGSSPRHILVMELLEGSTLRVRLRDGPLPPRKAADLGAQIAEALAAAHAKGIVHRDLKPENVFVNREGSVKILDFGLAKQVALPASVETTSPTETLATAAGAVVGTLGYLSPEQVRGFPADQRSDIFSLGCVLYETLSGSQAFKRPTPAETMTAVLRDEPPPLSVSPELSALVFRCLEKEPQARYQSAQDLAYALRSLPSVTALTQPAAPAPARPTVYSWLIAAGAAFVLVAVAIGLIRARQPPSPHAATLNPKRVLVLPFENRTGDKSFDSVGAMAADWIIQGLTQTGELQVIPLATVLSYSRDATWKPAPGEGAERLAALSAETGAGTVVSGACYLSGGRLHVKADVFDMREKKLLGAVEPAEAPVEEPLHAVHALRQRLMVMLAMHLNPRTAPVASAIGQPPSFEAYKMYIAGLERFMVRDYRAAIPLLTQSADPGHAFSQPLLLAAFGHMNLGDFAEAEAISTQLEKERELLSLLDRTRLDQIEAFFRGDMIAQLEAARKGDELAPLGGATFEHGRAALRAGYPREAIDAFRRLRPESPFVREWIPYWWSLTWSQHLLGDSAGMLESANLGRQLHPGSLQILQAQGTALLTLGRFDELERLNDVLLTLPNELRAQPSAAILVLRASPSSVMLAWGDELRWHGHLERSRVFVTRALEWLAARPEAESRSAAHRTLLAQALFSIGRDTEAETVLSRLAAEYPDRVAYRGLLGVLAARRGDRKSATEISKRLREVNQPYLFGSQTRYAGEIASWLGEKEQAVALLREALGQGLTPLELHADGLLFPIWDYPPFQELLNPKG